MFMMMMMMMLLHGCPRYAGLDEILTSRISRGFLWKSCTRHSRL